MLDIALIREKSDWVKEQIRKLNDETALGRIDEILAMDEKRRAIRTEIEALQGHRNRLNKNLGKLRGNKKIDESARVAIAVAATAAVERAAYDDAIRIMEGLSEVAPVSVDADAAFDHLNAALKVMGDGIDAGFNEVKALEEQLEEQMLWVPNLPHDSVPLGESEEQNIPWEPEGEMRTFDFEPRPLWEFGPELGIVDYERGVKLSGSRFYILRGWGARLQRALIDFFLDSAISKGFTETYVPFMVKEEAMYGSSQFPKFRDVVYHDQEADLYMLPTAEVALTNMHAGEIFNESDLPLYYVAHTPCFRREKASAGRDVRGIKRVHQFEKVEMYKFTTPEKSYEELETMVEAAADLCRALRIPFRRLEIATGDLGFSATKKYDLEMWSPGQKEWLEVSSCSNTESFQARRAQIRYYPEGSKKTEFVHTLNGSGLALPRVIIAIAENYQTADGEIEVPEVLRPYLGGVDMIRRA